MTPDSVCADYSLKDVKLVVRQLDDDVILIEGSRETLTFLGNLLLAQAVAEDAGFEISPLGPGSRFFAESAEIGLYIHRT